MRAIPFESYLSRSNFTADFVVDTLGGIFIDIQVSPKTQRRIGWDVRRWQFAISKGGCPGPKTEQAVDPNVYLSASFLVYCDGKRDLERVELIIGIYRRAINASYDCNGIAENLWIKLVQGFCVKSALGG